MGGASGSTSSTTGSGGAGGTQSFTPADLPGLVLWLDDDKGVVPDPQHPTSLLKWLDQSGNANDAVAMSVQDGFRFEIDPSAVHGHDAFVCPGNGTRLEVADAASLRFGFGDYALAVVARKPTTGASFKSLFEKDSGNGGILFGFATDYEFHQGLLKVVVGDPNQLSFHASIMQGPALRLSVDGAASSGQTATNNVDGVGWPAFVCWNGAGNGQEIAEVVVVKGVLPDIDVTRLQGYFNQKFGL